MEKLSTINYNFHVSNFLAKVVQSQRNLEVKLDYFFTADVWKLAQSLCKFGLLAGVRIEDSPCNHRLKKLIDYSALSAWTRKRLVVQLKYSKESPVIIAATWYSSPGRRLYVSYHKLKKLFLLNTGSFIFVSTASHGVVSAQAALKNRVGGLLLFKIN